MWSQNIQWRLAYHLIIFRTNWCSLPNYHTILSLSMCLTWGFISGLLPQKGLLAQDSQACLVNYNCLPPFPSPVTDSEINWHMIQTETRSFSETLNVDVREWSSYKRKKINLKLWPCFPLIPHPFSTSNPKFISNMLNEANKRVDQADE